MSFIKTVAEFSDHKKHTDSFDFPPKVEEWKYTRLNNLQNFNPTKVPNIKPLSKTENQIIFENSKLTHNTVKDIDIDDKSSSKNISYKNDDVLNQLNQMISQNSYQLDIVKSCDETINIHSVGDAISGSRIHLKVSSNTKASVCFNPDSLGVTCNVFAVTLEEGSILDFYNVEDIKGTNLDQYIFNISKNATLNFINVMSGTGTSRLNGVFNLNCEGASLTLDSISCVYEKAHIDNHFYIHHNAPNTYSQIDVRSILSGTSKYIYNGLVFVNEKCDGSDSDQINQNILLSDYATVNAKPELKILSDDVKAKHGCTTGRIEDEELFYICTRGLDEKTASRLILDGYVTGITKKINFNQRKSIDDRLLGILDSIVIG